MTVVVLALWTLAGCGQRAAEADSTAPVPPVDEAAGEVVSPLLSETSSPDGPSPSATPMPRQTASAAKAATPQKTGGAKAAGKAETIYVETDGAQGRVWGHVTMKGDRGSGTIHDWDENTLAVTVTRHGNELFAVDQNSRQYVFRLKQ